ncbi:hypothetical protein GGR56DRAFT_686537 [Xylariaceae sp. FL0804]|nr:hypothetical protein GGR56DRAFT_686537 [Xylariaceae sp. FL0804]
MDDANSSSSADFATIRCPADVYARENGLSVDSQVDPLSLALSFGTAFPSSIPTATASGLTSDSSLARLRIPVVRPLNEQLLLSKKTVELLGKVVGRDDNLEAYAFASLSRIDARLGVSRWKLEPPILSNDLDYDCRELERLAHRQARAIFDPDIFPADRLDNVEARVFDIIHSTQRFKEELGKTIYNERLGVSKDAMCLLAQALRNDCSEAEPYKLAEIPEGTLEGLIVTPPICSPIFSPGYFVPDDAVCQIPAASEPSSLLGDDLDAAEQALLRQDVASGGVSSPSQHITPELSSIGNPPSLSPTTPSLDTLKFEPPLTPLKPEPSGLQSLYDEMIHLTESMDMDGTIGNPPPLGLKSPNGNDTEASLDGDLSSRLEKNAAEVFRSIEQERLEDADALARIDVPLIDLALPEAPWKGLPLETSAHQKWIIKQSKAFEIPKWRGNPDVDSQLRWFPFSRSIDHHLFLKESIEDDGQVEEVLDFPRAADVPTSLEFTWKEPGFSILREPDDDEESEAAPREEPKSDMSLASLAKKRRRQADDTLERSSSSSSVDLVKVSGIIDSSAQHLPSNTPIEKTPGMLISLDDTSATSTLLTNYIEFHTAKKQKTGKSTFFPTSASGEAERPIPRQKRPASRPPTTKPSVADSAVHHQRARIPAPCPSLPDAAAAAAQPAKIIRSVSLGRGLTRRLERLLPRTEIIERDFARWNGLAWDSRRSVLRSPVPSPLAAEADVAVSPATGVVVTTLLQAMQKPLPAPAPGHHHHQHHHHEGGEGARPQPLSAIRARIAGAALRYERLIVLVSEGSRDVEADAADTDTAPSNAAPPPPPRDLTPTECAAYAEFAGFVAAQGGAGRAQTQTWYVGGGEDALARWLAHVVVRHAHHAASAPAGGDHLGLGVVGWGQELVIADETRWELFLRRAGLNAYAAQVVIGCLKAPAEGGTTMTPGAEGGDGDEEEEEEERRRRRGAGHEYGLAAFVRMSAAERRESFGSIMGGERVLDRVSRVLDMPWQLRS